MEFVSVVVSLCMFTHPLPLTLPLHVFKLVHDGCIRFHLICSYLLLDNKFTHDANSHAHKYTPPTPHTLLPAVHSFTLPDLYASIHSHTPTHTCRDVLNSQTHKSRAALGDKSDECSAYLFTR